MKATKVVIDHHQWMLPQDVDLPQLKDAVDTMVKGGGGLVHFTASGHREVSALVTKGIPVYFEVVDVDTDHDVDDGPGYVLDDLDI